MTYILRNDKEGREGGREGGRARAYLEEVGRCRVRFNPLL